ncbi:hypothetical protein [uncultured Microbacterium sp.]|uniref:hypothetical protein n=1 Tax=uncultured Microbacterium sp. TaxID=191216 RepID=UPI0025D6F972|nr:hypothetical protein [uncultured Microbacterium sp.]
MDGLFLIFDFDLVRELDAVVGVRAAEVTNPGIHDFVLALDITGETDDRIEK